MEALQLPQAEIRKRFTFSDLAILGWRGAEMNYNMRSSIAHSPSPREQFGDAEDMVERAYQSGYYGNDAFADRCMQIEEQLGDVANKMVDDRGHVDLRRLTGDEAMRFMGAMGISVPRLG